MFDKRLVLDFFTKLNERIRKERIFERELKVERIRNKAISIIGPRRAGKTFWLLKTFRSQLNESIYIDFENIAFRNVAPKDVIEIVSLAENYFDTKVKTLFLDEIQRLREWESLVRSLLDLGYYIFISGSSSKLLSKEIATQLRGRTLSYVLLPLSFREFLEVKGFRIRDLLSLSEEVRIKRLLEDYIGWGSYPEVVLYQEKREKLLREYYDLIFYRDFVERFGIKSLNVAELLFEFFLQNFSKEMSINKIVNFVNLRLGVMTRSTIYDYVDKISDIFFAFFVERLRKSVYERKSWPKKIYICDLGLSNLISFERDYGKRMENVVFLELLRKTNEHPLWKIYYWKDHQQREVDFVVKEGLKVKQLIQVCYDPSDLETKDRELKALIKASKQLNCKNLLVITWDYEAEEEFKGKKIKFMPLWKWLLKSRK